MKIVAKDWIDGRPNPIALSRGMRTRILKMPIDERVATVGFLMSISKLAQGRKTACRDLAQVLGGKRNAADFGKRLQEQLRSMVAESNKKTKSEAGQ